MSAKYFCDICEEPMTATDTGRVKRKLGNCEVEIMAAFNGGWNNGHLCHSCIIKAVNYGTPSQGLTS